jgi:putative SOS response-associated peptidase YedK
MVNFQPRYNIARIITHDDRCRLPVQRQQARIGTNVLGLILAWWKKTAKEAPSTFNALAKTVAKKPVFRAAFKRCRCVIPASGYYEWKPTEGGKQPYCISEAGGSVLLLAGLWDEWQDVETGEPVKSCTIIVTAAISSHARSTTACR